MHANSTEFPRVRCLTTTIITALALLLPTQQLLAASTYLETFNRLYQTTGTALDGCGVCHNNFNGSGVLNPYGIDFQAQPGRGAAQLQAIENESSDSDNTSNIDEIRQGFFPGWDCGNYLTASGDTPADFKELVDPVNAGCVVNSAPIADAGMPYAADLGAEVIFDGSGSIDPEGDPLTYSWDFGDGSSSSPTTDPTTTHRYAAAGVYQVALTVDDGSLSRTVTTLAVISVSIVPICDFSVSTRALDLGIVDIGETATAVRIVTNAGDAACELMAEIVDNSGVGQFSLVSSPTFSIAPAGSAEVAVQFAPLVKGADRRDELRISSDDPNNRQEANIPLWGVGIVPTPPESCSFVVTDPDIPLDFGDVEINANATLPKIVTNNGSVACDISAMVVSATGQFTLASGSTLSIPPGFSADFSVTFAPVAEGRDDGILSLLSNDVNQPLSVDVALVGSGVAPPLGPCDFSVDPASLAFGGLTIGSSSTLSTMVTNNGGAACSLIALVAGSGEFTLATASPVVVAAGGSASVSVDYAPIDVGADSGDLTLTDAVTAQTVDVGLSGSGADVPATVCEGLKVKAKWKTGYKPHAHGRRHHHWGKYDDDDDHGYGYGHRHDPIPCRVQVGQPDLGLCGQADVINAPADCGAKVPDDHDDYDDDYEDEQDDD